MIVETMGAVNGVRLHLLMRGIIAPNLNGPRKDLTGISSKGARTLHRKRILKILPATC